MILKLPIRVTSENIGKSIIGLDMIHTKEPKQVVIDLSATEYLDTEGLNYLALLPFYIQNILQTPVRIILPTTSSLISFMDYTGLTKALFDEFQIEHYTCPEDVMFMNKAYKKSTYQNARVGVITQKEFQKFLRNELANLEKILNSEFLGEQFCQCFFEITQNIFDHSGETVGGFSFHLKNPRHTHERKHLALTISDIGFGIKSTLEKKLDINSQENDSVFIAEALREGISGTGWSGRGRGLTLVKDLMEEVQVTSGLGQVTTKDGIIIDKSQIANPLKGTSISVKINLN